MDNRNELIEKIFLHTENGDVDKAVFACLRLSRSIGDFFHTVLFMRELRPDKTHLEVIFNYETNSLTTETQDLIWKQVTELWLKGRTLDESFTDDPEKTVLTLGVGEMKREIENIKETIKGLTAPSGMEPFDLAAFTDKYDLSKSQFRLRLNGVQSIYERIRTRCFEYATRIEQQLRSQAKIDSFMTSVQNEVNSYFSSRSESTYNKLIKAADLINSNDSEDHALLLTAIRKAIKAVADHFYPPQKKEVKCQDGKFRKLGNDQYLNRLQEFMNSSFGKSSSDELIKHELEYFMIFARKINDIASKGVHDDVRKSEAKQGLLGLYLLLSNLIEKLDQK